MTPTYFIFNKYVTEFNKHINLDMKKSSYWLNAKKIALNVQKPEFVIFRHQRKKRQ